MRRSWSVLSRAAAFAVLASATALAQVQVTSLADDGWYSDDTRADGTGTQSAGTNLKSTVLTDMPEAGAGNPAHDADILAQIAFVDAPGSVPSGTWPAALHLVIGPSGSGKSQVSHRRDDGTGHAPGSVLAPGFTASYSWMADGTISVTPSLKFGIKTAEFGSTPVSSRTGENVWDKVLIYEPGNLNGGTADGLWHTETISFTSGKWWFFDRTAGAGTIGTPMTLSAMSGNATTFSGAKTIGQVFALITAPGAHITSVQFGIGSGNAGGSVYVNQFATSAYLGGDTVRFGAPALLCDQDVTSAAIFGSGNTNGSFHVARVNGIELGLRGKLRFNALNLAENTFNSNGDGTYSFSAGHPTGGAGWVTPNTPRWNFEWSINTDWDGSTGLAVEDLTYQLEVDVDASPGITPLVFDPIGPSSAMPFDTPTVVPFWDHSFGTNATASGAGTEAASAPAYAALLSSSNLVQNSWNIEFFNEAPFDGFNPDVAGRYDISLAAFQGATEVARTSIAILVEAPVSYDQNVTPDAIFGGGNANGSYTVARADGVELGLRGKLRFPASNVFNSNGDGTYTFDTGSGTGAFPNSEWAFEFSVNSDWDGSSGRTVGDLTWEIGMDNDPSGATDYLVFDPISIGTIIPYTVPLGPIPYWDHSMGTNATPNGGGLEAADGTTYATYLGLYNVAQNSWRPTFYQNTAPWAWNPNVPGRYEYYLAARDGGHELARTAISIIATDGTSLIVEADACQADYDCDTPGVQVAVELHARNLASAATGWQAFLQFDPARLTYVGALSSYSASPFPTHVQPIATANVSTGELRLDGSNFSGSTTADSLLATLVFTVTDECTAATVDFDLDEGFDSELSHMGSPLATSLVGSPSIVADATPPVLAAVADITVAADASLAGGCSGRVVTFTAPLATDNCGGVTVECFPPSGTEFPVGTTPVTCVATDACGNVSTRSFDVTVTSTNVVTVSVQLVGVTTATVRCIRFQTEDCVIADIPLAFDSSGLFTGDIEIPCGSYTALCAKDRQHTLWDTVPLTVGGTKYVATGTLMLEGGDTDDDGDVDINDVTWLIAQFGMVAASGGCPWNTVTRDADFSNNAVVGSEDYVFQVSNWLTASACACTVPAVFQPRRPLETRPYVLAKDAVARAADLNGDGWVDHLDVRLFEDAHGLPHELSETLRAATPSSR